MKVFALIMIALAVIAQLALWARGFSPRALRASVVTALTFLFHAPRGFAHGMALANINEGVHEGGRITKKADAAISTRHLVVKIGSDANHIAVAGTGDIALGVCQDEPSAAEELAAVQLLGCAGRTVTMVASAAISAGALVVTAASGKIRTLPGTTGTYYVIGRALEAAGADGDPIEVEPCFPTQRVVA